MSGGDVKASPRYLSEDPRGLKTQEGIGLLVEVTPLPVVTDCCPDQSLEGGAVQVGAISFGWW
jgi:hypothetical protein